MSYLVLARKFRPQTFAEMVGQEHVTRTIANAIEQGRVHHAFLFCGARGVGKTTAARILAKCLSCVQGPTASPCNQCVACQEITAGSSVDVQEIDGASNNSVDDVRTLREGVRYLPSRGKKKVYIIDEVHMLSSGAWNALLKTLEEPPAHAVFIFATTEVHKIPVTILSRLQRYDFRLVPSPRIAAHLGEVLREEGVAFEAGALTVIAREAAGSVRDSLSLLEQVLASGAERLASAEATAEALGVADRTLVSELAEAIVRRDPSRALALLDRACERSLDFKHLTHRLLEQLRDLVVVQTIRDPEALVEASESELGELRRVAALAGEGLLELVFHRLARLAEEVARSPLPRFVLEIGLVELCRVEPLEPLGELVERLAELESRLERGEPRPKGGPGDRGGGEGPRSSGPGASPSAERGSRSPEASRGARPSGPTPSSVSPLATSPTTSPSPSPAPSFADPTIAASPRAPAAPAPTSWTATAELLLAHNMARFACFQSAQEVAFAPPRIVVAFKTAFDADLARSKQAEATALLRERFGPACTLEIQVGAGRAPSALEAEEQRRRDDQERRRRAALEHPARTLVRERFGDEVIFKDPEVES